MSGDTSQARYFCLYNDCTFTGHADENAAINIGWRYLTERIDADASRKKLGELKV
jgi:transposase